MQVSALCDWNPSLTGTLLERNGREWLLMRKSKSVESLALLMTRVLLADHIHASLSFYYLQAWWAEIIRRDEWREYLATLAKALHWGTDFHSLIRSKVLMEGGPILQWECFLDREEQEGTGWYRSCSGVQWLMWRIRWLMMCGGRVSNGIGSLLNNREHTMKHLKPDYRLSTTIGV